MGSVSLSDVRYYRFESSRWRKDEYYRTRGNGCEHRNFFCYDYCFLAEILLKESEEVLDLSRKYGLSFHRVLLMITNNEEIFSDRNTVIDLFLLLETQVYRRWRYVWVIMDMF